MMAAHFHPGEGKLPGEWSPPDFAFRTFPKNCPVTPLVGEARIIQGLLSAEECHDLIRIMPTTLTPVSVSGHVSADSMEIGSRRATAWGPRLGDAFWAKLAPYVPKVREMSDTTSTDWWSTPNRTGHRRWAACGVSPVLRFMRYEAGGEHNTHYDAGYDYPNDPRRTLMSFVAYLSGDPTAGGATRFIEDGQGHLPVWARNHDDWTRRAREDEVIGSSLPVAGNVLFFDHRQAHDVSAYKGSVPRIIIRGDIIFTALS